jgi:hypothetical protein
MQKEFLSLKDLKGNYHLGYISIVKVVPGTY